VPFLLVLADCSSAATRYLSLHCFMVYSHCVVDCCWYLLLLIPYILHLLSFIPVHVVMHLLLFYIVVLLQLLLFVVDTFTFTFVVVTLFNLLLFADFTIVTRCCLYIVVVRYLITLLFICCCCCYITFVMLLLLLLLLLLHCSRCPFPTRSPYRITAALIYGCRSLQFIACCARVYAVAAGYAPTFCGLPYACVSHAFHACITFGFVTRLLPTRVCCAGFWFGCVLPLPTLPHVTVTLPHRCLIILVRLILRLVRCVTTPVRYTVYTRCAYTRWLPHCYHYHVALFDFRFVVTRLF